MSDREIYTKKLPVLMCKGYVSAFWSTFGGGTTPASILVGKRYLTQDPQTSELWRDDIYRYISTQNGRHEPLDYLQISSMVLGYVQMNSEHMRMSSINATLRRVGRQWWWGEAPNSAKQTALSLLNLIGPIITETLKYGGNPQRGYVASTYLGLLTFIEYFHYHSQIECTWQQEDEQLIIDIQECPFCLNKSDGCGILLGVLEGVLAWLQGNYYQPYNPTPYPLGIDEEQSSAHHIVFVPMRTETMYEYFIGKVRKKTD
jgi:hypothetical protein